MAFFLAFLVITTVVVLMVPLSLLGRLALSLTFALTLIFGAFATIQRCAAIYFVIGLTASSFVVALIAESGALHALEKLDTTLKVACLSILVFMTLKRTLRPGRVTKYRVIGGIAGYFLIGFTWTFAYQLLVQQVPGAIHFEPGMGAPLSRQPSLLIYFSFMTLTTVGYGDVRPLHPAARSLAVVEALVGQLYLAVLIASLIGMPLQARSEEEVGENSEQKYVSGARGCAPSIRQLP